MDPKFWGPGLWKAIHSMAATADTLEDRKHFREMMSHMTYVLPCKVCRKHLQENMKKHSIGNYMQSNETLFMWTYLLHDAVNKAQGKSNNKRPEFSDIFNSYFRQNQSNNNEIGYNFENNICSEVCSGEQVISNAFNVVKATDENYSKHFSSENSKTSNSLNYAETTTSNSSIQKMNSKSFYKPKFKSFKRR